MYRGIRFVPVIKKTPHPVNLGIRNVHAQPDLRRELLPAYTYRGLVTGWSCSVCQEAFRIPLEQATDVLAAPAEIQQQFERHSCLRAVIEPHPMT